MNIDFAYEKAMTSADEIERLAKQLEQSASDNLEGVMGEMRSVWESENADAFCEKSRQLQTKLNKTASDLCKVAVSIRDIAHKMRAAELSAENIARV